MGNVPRFGADLFNRNTPVSQPNPEKVDDMGKQSRIPRIERCSDGSHILCWLQCRRTDPYIREEAR